MIYKKAIKSMQMSRTSGIGLMDSKSACFLGIGHEKLMLYFRGINCFLYVTIAASAPRGRASISKPNLETIIQRGFDKLRENTQNEIKHILLLYFTLLNELD